MAIFRVHRVGGKLKISRIPRNGQTSAPHFTVYRSKKKLRIRRSRKRA